MLFENENYKTAPNLSSLPLGQVGHHPSLVTTAKSTGQNPSFQGVQGGGNSVSGGRSWYIADTVAAFALQPAPILNSRKIFDANTGEVLHVKRGRDGTLEIVQTPSQKRALKWARKAALREVLGGGHRVACCHRNPVKGGKQVEVWAKLDAFLPGHYAGLQTCALPWLCPICSPKIAERRAAEIQKAMDQCLAEGGQVLMPTFTIPHGREQPLAETLDLIKQALRWMARHRQYKQLQDRLGVEGRIIATEITHGEANGWHPHFHELWFFRKSGIDATKLERDLFNLWVLACSKFGLGEPSRKHGVVVQDGSYAAHYVSKMGQKSWTLADEISKANAKSGRRASRSFWQLIDIYMDDSSTPQQSARAKQLIREYSEAVKNRKSLTWTPGLKKRFEIEDSTDGEIAAQQIEDAVLVAEISLPDWKIVIRHRLEAVILDACLRGRAAIAEIIEAYRAKEIPRNRRTVGVAPARSA